MPRELLALAFGFAALILAVGPGHAEGAPCGARALIIEQLGNRYQETRRAVGLASNNAVLEIFASEDSGSFTILVTMPDGRSCLVASGEHFQPLSDPLPTPGKGA